MVGKPPVVPRTRDHNVNRSDGGMHRPSEDRSRAQKTTGSGASGTSSRSTPKDLVIGALNLSRDLSDLSGSYHHGHVGSTSAHPTKAIPQHIYKDDASSVSSMQKSWAQAYVLSNPSPDVILSDLMDATDKKKPRIFLEENNSVELVRQTSVMAPSFDEFADAPRIPLLVLLMDTNKRSYEMLRIFVDCETDSVRDVLQSVRKNLPDQWKQDYDGLFQIRSGIPSQLIHCLSVQNYDLRPYECWIAKPWSMAAKVAGHNGVALIDHLKHIGVLVDTTSDTDVIVRLSQAAESRIYEPDGRLDHHHAQHYLSFSPPFEKLKSPRFGGDRSVVSQRSRASNKSRSSSLDAGLQALKEEDDDQTYSEESQEVETVSSYSYLSSVNPFPSIIEEDAAAEEKALRESIQRRKYVHAEKLPDSEERDDAEERHTPKLHVKGLVGKLLKRTTSISLHNPHRNGAASEQLLSSAMKAGSTWDLTPMNCDQSFASYPSLGEEVSHYSKQPLLQCTAAIDKPSLFRRNKQLNVVV